MEDTLGELLHVYSGSPLDTCWHEYLSLSGPTGPEVVATRERQIVQLARHGRQQIDSLERWTVSRIVRWHRRLREQVDAETDWERIAEQ